MTPTLTSLDHLVLTVQSIDATIEFYQTVLGMKSETFVGTDGSKRFAVLFGDQKINLHQTGSEFDPKAHAPTPGSADLCFLSSTDLTVWLAHLSFCNVQLEDGPIQRTGAIGPIRSLYIRDPDRNLIEISNPMY